MADAVATPTPTFQRAGGDGYRVTGTIAISASPAVYVANGIVLSFLQAAIKAQRVPRSVVITGISGYVYSYVAGTTAGDGLLRIFAQTSAASEDDPLGQLAASAIPAAVSSDTITFNALWDGQL
jgi:hypothetical protein